MKIIIFIFLTFQILNAQVVEPIFFKTLFFQNETRLYNRLIVNQVGTLVWEGSKDGLKWQTIEQQVIKKVTKKPINLEIVVPKKYPNLNIAKYRLTFKDQTGKMTVVGIDQFSLPDKKIFTLQSWFEADECKLFNWYVQTGYSKILVRVYDQIGYEIHTQFIDTQKEGSNFQSFEIGDWYPCVYLIRFMEPDSEKVIGECKTILNKTPKL